MRDLSRLVWMGMVVLSLCGAGVARAEDMATTQAREHYGRGAKAFALGKFDEAIKEYEAAYELRDDPVFLYNIAQAHRLNRNSERALFFYRSYLSRSPNAPNAADVSQKIADLQKLVDQQARSQAAAPQAAITPAPEAPAPASVAPAPAPTSAPPPVVADATVGRGKKIAGISLIVGGDLILTTGIILSALVPGINDDLRQTAARGGTYDPSVQTRAQTFQVVGPVLDVVGVLVATGGGVLLYLGQREQKRAARAAVTPVVASGFAGAVVRGSF